MCKINAIHQNSTNESAVFVKTSVVEMLCHKSLGVIFVHTETSELPNKLAKAELHKSTQLVLLHLLVVLCRCYRLKKLVLTTNKLLTLPEGLYFLNLEVSSHVP